MKAIITVIGKDQVGIIALVCNILAEVNINVLDINQTTMRDYFTMIMLVDITAANKPFKDVSERLEAAGESKGLTVQIQRQEIFDSMHKI